MTLPGSKSQSLRAILLASLNQGQSQVVKPLQGCDTWAMTAMCSAMGAQIQHKDEHWLIEGTAGKSLPSWHHINAYNSGLVFRLGAGVAMRCAHRITIDGDASIRQRPIAPLLQAVASQVNIDGMQAPLSVCGPLQAGRFNITDGRDSQCVSALLIALAYCPGSSEVVVEQMGEVAFIDMTCHWLRRIGVDIERQQNTFTLEGQKTYPGFEYRVPSDMSALAFVIAVAMVTRSVITVTDFTPDQQQGDAIIIEWARSMGCHITIDKTHCRIDGTQPFYGGTFDMALAIDAVPVMMTLGCFASTPSTLLHTEGARCKESDRVAAMQQALTLMGAKIHCGQDRIEIFPSPLHGQILHGHHDHRVVMALAIAAWGSTGNSQILGAQAIDKSFPTFFAQCQRLGLKVQRS